MLSQGLFVCESFHAIVAEDDLARSALLASHGSLQVYVEAERAAGGTESNFTQMQQTSATKHAVFAKNELRLDVCQNTKLRTDLPQTEGRGGGGDTCVFACGGQLEHRSPPKGPEPQINDFLICRAVAKIQRDWAFCPSVPAM